MIKSEPLAKDLLAMNIKIWRKKLGISQEKLAEAADLSTQTISDIEGCRTWVGDKTLERLAFVLHIDIFQLFMPSDRGIPGEPEPILYHRITKLRSDLKEDVDKRLEQFFLSEKALSR